MKWFGKIKRLHLSVFFVVVGCIFQGAFQYVARSESLELENLYLMASALLASVTCFIVSCAIFRNSNAT